MSGKRPYTAFTLIELMAVTVLLVGAVGWATLSFHGLGERGRLEAAAEQIASAYRVAGLVPQGSGLPGALRCDGGACVVQVPRYVNDEWHWVAKGRFALPEGARLLSVTNTEATALPVTESSWTIAAPAQPAWWKWMFRLGGGTGLRGELVIDAFTGESSVHYVEAVVR